MGSGNSQVDVSAISSHWYQTSLEQPCLLPDVGIDKYLLKYSGTNSAAELQVYSNNLINQIPDIVKKMGSTLGPLTPIPNAVGLGAIVISMILELMTTTEPEKEDSYSMLQRVFGGEKASSVRDTMLSCLRRHRRFLKNKQRLEEELSILERQMSHNLIVLRNSLLLDGQFGSHGFKIWVNGAYFHIQMLIHEARLKSKTKKEKAESAESIRVVIDQYLYDMDLLLDKYKTYQAGFIRATSYAWCYIGMTSSVCKQGGCVIRNDDRKHVQCQVKYESFTDPCESPDVMKAYIDHVFANYNPGLKSHFSISDTNLISLISQHDDFTLPFTT